MPSINSVENVNVIIMFYDCKRNPFWSESINFFTRFNIHGMEMGTPLHYWTKHIWSPLRLIYYVARFIFIFFSFKSNERQSWFEIMFKETLYIIDETLPSDLKKNKIIKLSCWSHQNNKFILWLSFYWYTAEGRNKIPEKMIQNDPNRPFSPIRIIFRKFPNILYIYINSPLPIGVSNPWWLYDFFQSMYSWNIK